MEGFEPVQQGCFGVLKIAIFEGEIRFLGLNKIAFLDERNKQIKLLWFISQCHLPSLKLTAKTPENEGLEDEVSS